MHFFPFRRRWDSFECYNFRVMSETMADGHPCGASNQGDSYTEWAENPGELSPRPPCPPPPPSGMLMPTAFHLALPNRDTHLPAARFSFPVWDRESSLPVTRLSFSRPRAATTRTSLSRRKKSGPDDAMKAHIRNLSLLWRKGVLRFHENLVLRMNPYSLGLIR